MQHLNMKSMSLLERVNARCNELERNLTDHDVTSSTRADIEAALAAAETLLTGDLEQIPSAVKADLSRWLELHRHLGLKAETPDATDHGWDSDN